MRSMVEGPGAVRVTPPSVADATAMGRCRCPPDICSHAGGMTCLLIPSLRDREVLQAAILCSAGSARLSRSSRVVASPPRAQLIRSAVKPVGVKPSFSSTRPDAGLSSK